MEAKHADPALIRRFLIAIAAVPIYECFSQFERELRDLAEITGKQMKPIRYTGGNPRVLAKPIQEFVFSLTHICRNIIDHGIEAPVTRMARGKDPAGQVSIHVDAVLGNPSEGEWLHIVISDDGNGIDPSVIRAKMATVDPHGSWRKEDDQKVIQHIFNFGFSTRENVTDLSGHGVGLEAVAREVENLGGTIRVHSELYRNTRFDIRIPYILDSRNKSSAEVTGTNNEALKNTAI
jgi:two-component system chemotaxis sensor kinase CheA